MKHKSGSLEKFKEFWNEVEISAARKLKPCDLIVEVII
jgi:hypothetical protein